MKTFLATTAALAMKLRHCLAAGSNSKIGERRTGAVLLELGHSVTTYTFDINRSFRVVTKFTRVGRPAMAVTGTSSTGMMG